jgi:pimeloyl-ACP methyl ester carboxylesterase
LQWVALEKKLREEKRPSVTTTIQLLGSVDDIVSPEDNIDMVTGGAFIYLDVPFSGHRNVIQLDASSEGCGRREVFRRALLEEVDKLRENSQLPGNEMITPQKPRDDVLHVIFVVHGIRDVGYWTNKIARRVQMVAHTDAPPQVYATETSTYGYFAMFPFLLPARRREKVEWLMDQYTEARALFPHASFSFIGHSNGTYLLAKALQQYPACRFDRVIFAGSVVRTDYDWKAAIERGQVKGVLNYLATADLVVAVFPGALEKLRLQDLGSAGFDGFQQADQEDIEQRCVRGGHGAALQEKNWDTMAEFIVNRLPFPKSETPIPPQPDCVVRLLGRFAPLVWVLIGGILLSGGHAIWHSRIGEGRRTFGLMAYIWCIWKVLTRV